MREFTKIFEQIARRHDYSTVFSDFLTMAICAFSLGRMEAEYMETIKRYQKDEINLFAKMLGALVMAAEDRSTNEGAWIDIFGTFFEEHNGKWSRESNGQFFTPEHLCDLMARVTYTPTDEYQTVYDPTCGSGRTLISCDRLDPMNRFRNFYIGQDVDYRCVKMCTLNFFFYGMSGVVIHSNTLSMEVWRGFRIWMPETGLCIQPLSKGQCIQYLMQQKEEAPAIAAPVPIIDLTPVPAGQLQIFA